MADGAWRRRKAPYGAGRKQEWLEASYYDPLVGRTCFRTVANYEWRGTLPH